MRKAEDILADVYEEEGWQEIAANVRAGNPTLGEKLVARAIEQAQREAIEEAASRCEGWSWGLAALADNIRRLAPHREGQ